MLILKTNYSSNNNNSNNILNVLFKKIYPRWYIVIYNDMTRSGFVMFPFRPDAEDSCIVCKPRTS